MKQTTLQKITKIQKLLYINQIPSYIKHYKAFDIITTRDFHIRIINEKYNRTTNYKYGFMDLYDNLKWSFDDFRLLMSYIKKIIQ